MLNFLEILKLFICTLFQTLIYDDLFHILLTFFLLHTFFNALLIHSILQVNLIPFFMLKQPKYNIINYTFLFSNSGIIKASSFYLSKASFYFIFSYIYLIILFASCYYFAILSFSALSSSILYKIYYLLFNLGIFANSSAYAKAYSLAV